jgi:hypothetical protein
METGIPPFPPRGARALAPVRLRFEDVTQDGRLALEALPAALAGTVWRGVLADSDDATALRSLRAKGVVPILTRLRLEGTRGPFSIDASVEAEGTLRLACADDGRFMVDMWANLYAPMGRTYDRVEGAGERILAGRVFAEHVLTRPFAPPGERRVTDRDFPEGQRPTATRPPLPAFEAIASVPDGATALDATVCVDPVAIAFGVVHTDSNRHVNSLAYLRVFEEAALRRFVAMGRSSNVLARTIDIGYRRPCFAGQTMRVAQCVFEAGGHLGTAAVLRTEADAAAPFTGKASTYARMVFEA